MYLNVLLGCILCTELFSKQVSSPGGLGALLSVFSKLYDARMFAGVATLCNG